MGGGDEFIRNPYLLCPMSLRKSEEELRLKPPRKPKKALEEDRRVRLDRFMGGQTNWV